MLARCLRDGRRRVCVGRRERGSFALRGVMAVGWSFLAKSQPPPGRRQGTTRGYQPWMIMPRARSTARRSLTAVCRAIIRSSTASWVARA